MRNRKRLTYLIIVIFMLALPYPALATAQDEREIRIAGIILKWIPERPDLNYQRAERLIREAAASGAQIICTTETFLDGYAIRNENLSGEEFRRLAEPVPDGKYYKLLFRLASELKIFLIPGLSEISGTEVYNSSLLLGPDGKLVGTYRKHYLFGKEKSVYTQGDSFPAFETDHGKIGMMICYDRQKPETVEQLRLNGAEIIFCLAGGGFGEWNRGIMQSRSMECGLPIIFVHPSEFLVTGADGSVLDNHLFGVNLDDDAKGSKGGEIHYYDLKY